MTNKYAVEVQRVITTEAKYGISSQRLPIKVDTEDVEYIECPELQDAIHAAVQYITSLPFNYIWDGGKAKTTVYHVSPMMGIDYGWHCQSDWVHLENKYLNTAGLHDYAEDRLLTVQIVGI